MPLPCVVRNLDGLSVLQATADQRYALGKDLFLSTHLPVRFWKYRAGIRETWTEEDFLQSILAPVARPTGNRVYVLFGAAGSGKSEVMRWLMCRIADAAPERERFTVRISRTELDPVRIVHRLLSTFELPGIDQQTLQRWSVLRRKPVAVANQVVWQTLTSLLDQDEEILPLSYRLRPVVEANLRASFAAMDDPDVAERPMELLSLEQMEQALADTVLPLNVSYEQVRTRLQEAFDSLILGGVRLVPALQSISRQVSAEFGIRPLLFIDDLVQSMNVYASDLLDYLITLEEGEWDVVVGLTPASFEMDRRGRELLARIRELDTVDDRVVKLDLSDATGDHSAFLQEDSAPDLVMAYLDQYKRMGGYECGERCPHWSQCCALQWGRREDTRLGPFNRPFVSRLWNALPSGKGRVRYLLLAVRDVLETMALQGTAVLTELPRFVRRERFVEHEDAAVRALLECYGPLHSDVLHVPEEVGAIWGLKVPGTAVVHKLVADDGLDRQETITPESNELHTDPVLAAVRDWLEGGLPNPELLRPLRAGAARLARDLVDPGLLAGIGHAQCAGVLRWSSVHHGANLPVSIEGVDADEKALLHVNRRLGGVAFDLIAYGTSRGQARSVRMQRLLNEPQVLELICHAEEQRRVWLQELEGTLDCSVPELAFHLYRVMTALGGGDSFIPLELRSEATKPLSDVPWPDELRRLVSALFQDSFLIREHLWDGCALSQLIDRFPTPEDSLKALELIFKRHPALEERTQYRIGNLTLHELLNRYQEHLWQVLRYLRGKGEHFNEWRQVAETYLALGDGRRRRAILRRGLRLNVEGGGNLLLPVLPSVLFGLPQDWSEAVAHLHPVLDLNMSSLEQISPFKLYRAAAHWESAERYRSLVEVIQWRNDLNRVLEFLRTKTSPLTKSSPALPTLSLLDTIQAMLVRAQACTDTPRSSQLVSPVAGLANLRYLLGLLTPGGFKVVQWLEGSLPQNADPSALSPLDLVRKVASAAAWWQAYVSQLADLQPDKVDGDFGAVCTFIENVAMLEEPTPGLVKVWTRFLTKMKKDGIVDLPVLSCLATAESLPTHVRDWLSERAEGSALTDLDPDLLKDLVRCAPSAARALRITLVPGGRIGGVLRVMDGQ